MLNFISTFNEVGKFKTFLNFDRGPLHRPCCFWLSYILRFIYRTNIYRCGIIKRWPCMLPSSKIHINNLSMFTLVISLKSKHKTWKLKLFIKFVKKIILFFTLKWLGIYIFRFILLFIYFSVLLPYLWSFFYYYWPMHIAHMENWTFSVHFRISFPEIFVLSF